MSDKKAKKLYRVAVEYEMLVVAEDETAACDVAQDCEDEADMERGSAQRSAVEITDLGQLSPGDADCLPYGGDGDGDVERVAGDYLKKA